MKYSGRNGERTGDADASNINRTFTKLGYKVQLHQDLDQGYQVLLEIPAAGHLFSAGFVFCKKLLAEQNLWKCVHWGPNDQNKK